MRGPVDRDPSHYGKRDGGTDRDRDQRARAAIVGGTASPAHAFLYPHAELEHGPDGECQLQSHGAARKLSACSRDSRT